MIDQSHHDYSSKRMNSLTGPFIKGYAMGGVHFCTMFIGPCIGGFLCQRASKGDLKQAYSAVGDPLLTAESKCFRSNQQASFTINT